MSDSSYYDVIESIKKMRVSDAFMNLPEPYIVTFDRFFNIAIKALEKDKCSSCKHYDKDYGETCLNPEGTCRVFEYDGYEEEENVSE